MTVYKIEIHKQTREYSTQALAREALIKLLEAGVFHVKTASKDGKHIVELKGEITTYSINDRAVEKLLKALKTQELFYVESHISEENNK